MSDLSFQEVSAANRARCMRWHESTDLWTGADWANAMGGECGEAQNVVKKLRRIECGLGPGNGDPPEARLRQMLAEELADTVMYLDLLADFYDVDLPAAIVSKFNWTSRRNGFPERLPELYRRACPSCGKTITETEEASGVCMCGEPLDQRRTA